MMKQKLTALCLVIGFILTSACADKYQQAVRAGRITAEALASGKIVIEQLRDEGVLTADKASQILGNVTKAQIAVGTINTILSQSNKFDPKNREELFQLVDRLLTGVEKFNEEGLLFIQDENKRKEVRRIVFGIRLALRGIMVFLDSQLSARIERLGEEPMLA